MRDRITGLISFFLTIAFLSGCSSTPEHTNVMVFGTNTKFGIDASINPAGGTPDFTVGYKRQEVVWMPLLANVTKELPSQAADGNTAQNGQPTPGGTPSMCGDNCMYVGKAKDETDTYSVLASFGTEFGGRAAGSGQQGTSASGSGGLAQFFATGIAARNLATTGGARLVSIQGADTEELAKAEQLLSYQEAESKRIEDELKAAIGDETYKKIVEGVGKRAKTLRQKADEILAHISEGETFNTSAWTELVEGSELSDETQNTLKEFTLPDIRRYIDAQVDRVNEAHINAFHKQIGESSDD